MDTPTVTLKSEDDLSYVEGLLAENDLPSDDVQDKPGCFYVGYDDEERVGVGGIERDGTDGLLRSVVIERDVRGEGFGSALCDELEAAARGEGIETLYLLTTTAAAFFAERGYEKIERTNAPDAIRDTTEFSDLCPETATCMRKHL